MSDTFDFDGALDRAWVDFRAKLADDLAALRKGEPLSITCAYDSTDELSDVPAGLTFTVTGANRIRCEIPSNRVLHPLRMLDTGETENLVALGWRRRKSGSYVLETSRRQADRVAVTAVVAMREIWQVPHPAFLDNAGVGAPKEPDILIAVRPHGPSHLQTMVDTAMERLIGGPVLKDADGDIQLEFEDFYAWIRVRTNEPCVEFFTVLAKSVTDHVRVGAVFAEHSSSWPDIKLVLANDSALAVLRVDVIAFVAIILESAFAKWITFMEDGAAGIAEQLTSSPPEDEEAEEADEVLPAPLMCLLHLDPNGTGTLDARDVAVVCENDRDAILFYIRISSQEEIFRRQSAEKAAARGDQEEADACMHEAKSWAQTVASLRGALRFILLPHARGRQRQERSRA